MKARHAEGVHHLVAGEVIVDAGDLGIAAPFEGWPAETLALPGEITLSVRTTPAAPGAQPAVLVHGLGGSALNWTTSSALLADRLACRAPDLPGFGESPPPHDGDYGVDAHARAVEELIEADGHGPVHLFGNSLGGAVAVRLAARRPDLVRSLVLVSPALPDWVPTRWRTEVGALGLPLVGPALSRRVSVLTPEERVAGAIRLCFAEPSQVPDAWRQAAIVEAEARGRKLYAADALARSMRGLIAASAPRVDGLWSSVDRVVAPTLILHGARDALVPVRASRRAAHRMRHARLVVLPRAGHVAQMESPHVVARLVRDHLDRCAAAGRPG
ncbi:MAG TPA: alpha/beta hydrolase [Actinomycetes bacterium]|nr:alpha/beta hydrolase [Actinomycetes bacterium]